VEANSIGTSREKPVEVVVAIIEDAGEGVFGIVVSVNLAANVHLFFVVHAGSTMGAFFGLGQGREKEGCEDGKDGDDDEEFDQGEPSKQTGPDLGKGSGALRARSALEP